MRSFIISMCFMAVLVYASKDQKKVKVSADAPAVAADKKNEMPGPLPMDFYEKYIKNHRFANSAAKKPSARQIWFNSNGGYDRLKRNTGSRKQVRPSARWNMAFKNLDAARRSPQVVTKTPSNRARVVIAY